MKMPGRANRSSHLDGQVRSGCTSARCIALLATERIAARSRSGTAAARKEITRGPVASYRPPSRGVPFILPLVVLDSFSILPLVLASSIRSKHGGFGWGLGAETAVAGLRAGRFRF